MIPQIFVVLNSDEKIVSHIGGRPQKKNELVHYSSEGLLPMFKIPNLELPLRGNVKQSY